MLRQVSTALRGGLTVVGLIGATLINLTVLRVMGADYGAYVVGFDMVALGGLLALGYGAFVIFEDRRRIREIARRRWARHRATVQTLSAHQQAFNRELDRRRRQLRFARWTRRTLSPTRRLR